MLFSFTHFLGHFGRSGVPPYDVLVNRVQNSYLGKVNKRRLFNAFPYEK